MLDCQKNQIQLSTEAEIDYFKYHLQKKLKLIYKKRLTRQLVGKYEAEIAVSRVKNL